MAGLKARRELGWWPELLAELPLPKSGFFASLEPEEPSVVTSVSFFSSFFSVMLL